jgi:hypothetical protein
MTLNGSYSKNLGGILLEPTHDMYQHFLNKWHILAELSSETIGLMV